MPFIQDGWASNSMTNEHFIFKILYIEGVLRGSIESFHPNGPYYANAFVPAPIKDHTQVIRGGGFTKYEDARKWTEQKVGYKV